MTPKFVVIHGGLFGKPVPPQATPKPEVESLFDLIDEQYPRPKPTVPAQRVLSLVKTAAR